MGFANFLLVGVRTGCSSAEAASRSERAKRVGMLDIEANGQKQRGVSNQKSLETAIHWLRVKYRLEQAHVKNL